MEALVIVLAMFWLIPALSKRAARFREQTSRPATPRPVETVRPVRANPPPPPRLPVERESVDGWGQPYVSHEGMCDVHPERLSTSLVLPAEEPRAAAADVKKSAAGIPGLGIAFDAPSLVNGVIFAEILTRKTVRRRS